MENVARFEGQRRSRFGRGTVLLVALAVVVVVWALNVKDWHQLWTIVSAPDNIPIAALLIVVPFFTWLGLRQSRENDELIEQLEADPQLAKTHHRKTLPWRPGWARELHVWPYLVRIEFLAAVIVTVILFVWSILINAPLEEPANPNLTMNPSKAPWYFLGLQEMLVYFDPWIAGVVMPGLLIVGLMVFPYVDSNPLGNGYYTWRQRKFAISMFLWGFFMWIILILIGTFIRGPGWIWFWPGQTWDHNAVVFDRNRDLHEILGMVPENFQNHPDLLIWMKAIFGAMVVGLIFLVGGLFFHLLMTRPAPKGSDFTSFKRFKTWLMTPGGFQQKLLDRTSLLQYLTFQFFAISVLWLFPIKLILRLVFTIKYIWVTPWFNV
jgi:Cytochrome b(C-terminal)/b6/petD